MFALSCAGHNIARDAHKCLISPTLRNSPVSRAVQVARRGERPDFPSNFSWPGGPSTTRMVKDVIQACWAADPKDRLSAYQVMERLDDIKAKVRGPLDWIA